MSRRVAAAIARPFARRLQRRIVGLFLGMLLLVQAASFVTIRHSIESNAGARIAGELRTGENVLRRLLAANAHSLSEASRLLAADYGFRAAIASGDRATLADVLDNHGARIGAAVALYTDAAGELVASTLADASALLPLVRERAEGRSAPVAGEVALIDGRPFQLVTVPVRAPQLIGHVSMGFPLNATLLADTEQISALGAALLTRTQGEPWRVLPIGEHAVDWGGLDAQLGRGEAPATLELGDETYAARIVPLARSGTQTAAALLLQSIDAAVAPYRRLQWTLLGISLAAIAVFALGSIVTARTITRPIKRLAAEAQRLGSGDYAAPVPVDGHDEVHDLAVSFESMRQGLQQREAEIRRLAYWDALTGLPNRAQFRDLLRARLHIAQSHGEPLAVLMLDLDRFKHVNDVLGHGFGDRLLKRIATRLAGGALRDGDVVARLGGDEFAALLPTTDVDAATEIAHRLRRALEAPLTLDDHTIDVSAAVGIAIHPQHGEDADTLLSRAEMAMYAAKAQAAHEGGVALYGSALDTSSEESLSLLTELRTAVEQDQLRLFLQPKIAMATGQVIGAEALVRWQHPHRGMVAPMRFIPFAEQTGFIRVLTGWMIERCAARYRMLDEHGAKLKYSINLSTRDLLDQDLPAKLERQFARGSVRPEALCMEITESAIMDDPQRALQTLRRLHEMGLRLSIDDFGTGYSSLAYLKRLPLHELKIDKSFVMAMETDRADLKIVRSTIDLAHNLGLSVVAEGVENAQTWALLNALRCDEAQGYFMSKPMPEEAFAGWLETWSAPQTRLRTEFTPFV